MPVAFFQTAEARHRPKREIFRVAVIAQKKDSGKSRRCETLFLPKSILRLSPRKIAHPQSDRFVLDQAGGHQPNKAHAICDSVLGTRRRNVARIIQGVTLPTFSPVATVGAIAFLSAVSVWTAAFLAIVSGIVVGAIFRIAAANISGAIRVRCRRRLL